MNLLSLGGITDRLASRLQLGMRVVDSRRHAAVFSAGAEPDALQCIYVINLDRRPDRWRRVRWELDRYRERHGRRLSLLARRVSAVDARHMDGEPDASVLDPTFTLAEQLAIDPHPLLGRDHESHAHHQITMTREEIAVALSHIHVWGRIANGDAPSALVLEDDVFMVYGFAPTLEVAWSALRLSGKGEHPCDLLYLSFKEAGTVLPSSDRGPVGRPRSGIWHASGYVLTQEGARKLLDRLPAHGPVDLWLNLQFPWLNVLTTVRPIIDQRVDEPSTNDYSVLPVLSQLGLITRDSPRLPRRRRLRGPVVAVGAPGSGLTALAKALSVVGYTCCSDFDGIPSDEYDKLLAGSRKRLFGAYVNVGQLDGDALEAVARANATALFITTSDDQQLVGIQPERVLRLDEADDTWAALSRFLGIEYPSTPYPDDRDVGQRPVVPREPPQSPDATTELKFDRSPWILQSNGRGDRRGISVAGDAKWDAPTSRVDWTCGETLDQSTWRLRRDTFPGNLALFTPANFGEESGSHARLELRAEHAAVRDLTSAAIASRQSYRYGTFCAELRPANVPGLITGIFLHRNNPRQEIDIEFLGKDTTKLLVNVYYNPGSEGTKLEYGYRGTPTVVDLGFDAAMDYHRYEIDWRAHAISWKVDGEIICERVIWDPTPIPDQPLEFNVNLWHSRSTELAGRLVKPRLPASTELRSITVCGHQG